MKIKMVWIVVFLVMSAEISAYVDSNSVDASEQVSAGQPITLIEIRERGGIDRADGVVQGGVPFSRGVVSDPADLGIFRTDDGEPVPASFKTLSLWPDGSIRWALLTAAMPLAANASLGVEVRHGNALPYNFEAATLPSMILRIVRDSGVQDVPIVAGSEIIRDGLRARFWVEPLSAGRTRVRTWVAQDEGDDRWHSLSVVIASRGDVIFDPTWGSVHDVDRAIAVNLGHRDMRGPISLSTSKNEFELFLYRSADQPYPADRGFHVSHDVVLEDRAMATNLARRLAAPLRLRLDPSYVRATAAAGDLGLADAMLDQSIADSIEKLRTQQQLAVNRGWVAFGAFAVPDGNLSYMGYYNQEYDPASALMQYYLRSGDEGALDLAAEMARQYADASMSLDGASFQHRATQHLLIGTIGDHAAAWVRAAWRTAGSGPATEEQILAWARLPEIDIEDKMEELLAQSVTLSVAECEQWISDYLAFDRTAKGRFEFLAEYASFMHSGERGVMMERLGAVDPAALERLIAATPLPRDYALMYWAGSAFQRTDPPDVATLLAPMFARYGGNLEEMPRVFLYNTPDVTVAHSGGHTLSEMLVWGYLLTGDPILHDFALRSARHHVGAELLDDALAKIEEQRLDTIEGNVKARLLAWPLINMVALKMLTTNAEPELDSQLDAKMITAIEGLAKIPFADYDGSIQGGVTSEALARFHRATGDARATNVLLPLAAFWDRTYWNPDERLFDDPKGASVGLSFLLSYGLGYAAANAGDEVARTHLEEMYDTHAGARSTRNAKVFGMLFRSTQRGLVSIRGLDRHGLIFHDGVQIGRKLTVRGANANIGRDTSHTCFRKT